MSDEYRSRDLLRPHAAVEVALQQMYDAAAKTDPTKPGSAAGKDHQAFTTLLRSRDLVDAAAGWALDHVYGLSLAGHKMLPRQPRGSKHHPDYLASRTAADVHDHEREGGARIQEAPASPTLRRLILRNLVFAGAGGFPEWLRNELIEALDALDSGSITPILQSNEAGGTDIQISRLHLRFVCFVRFKSQAYNITIAKARQIIAEKIKTEAETLATWEKRLKTSNLSALDIDRELSFARGAAKSARILIEKGKDITEDDRVYLAFHEGPYGAEALATAVEEWNALKRGSK